jgi:endoglucanase
LIIHLHFVYSSVRPVFPFTISGTGKTYIAKGFDDRVGCALLIDVINNLVREKHPNTVYGVGTVQEEVGLRGARTSAWVVEPDVGLTLETGVAGDLKDRGEGKKMKGQRVKFMKDRRQGER